MFGEKEICGADEITPLIELKLNFNEATVLQLYEIETGVFSLAIILNASWNQDYNVKESKAYESIALLVANSIEDSYDKKFFNLDKSIKINVDSIEQVQDIQGILFRMKVFRLSGEAKLEELQSVIKHGVPISDEILNQMQKSEKSSEYIFDRFSSESTEATN